MLRPWLATFSAAGTLLRACGESGGPGAAPQDTHSECANWAKRGECDEREAQRVRGALQSEEQQALAAARALACAGAAEPSEGAVREAAEACRQRCGPHEDCLGQCERLAPRELHALLRRCAPWPLLSSEAVSAGLHVVCLVPAEACEDVGSHAVVFRNGRVAERPQETRGKLYQDSGFFTPGGERLLQLSSLLKEPTLLMFEGGQWVWPTVRLGHTTELPGLRSPGEVTHIRTVSLTPAVFEIDNFLLPDESEHIMQRVRHTIQKSPVAMKDADQAKAKAAKDFRTSSQEFLPTSGDDILAAVDERVQMLTRIPITHAEHIQVLRYNQMEHYSAHHDFFDPADYANNKNICIMNMIQNGATNRMATVFFYLTNVTRGGETNFPRAGGLPQPHDFFDCSRGYSSWPMANKVIIFYSMLPDGSMDKNSLHGGCDVLEGQKWSANFWLWNNPKSRTRGTASAGGRPAWWEPSGTPAGWR
ncbi:unnamed protein product [Prorocentrum cordatum]|uniref:Fe2OG dioxygenase domain-containing protein n=1 Tax=Prorocentrum cordatum TaxID=2364126 RepID=A0ABN9QXH6_9DINO|nr:unnamed protein product [Polarella glacialis]